MQRWRPFHLVWFIGLILWGTGWWLRAQAPASAPAELTVETIYGSDELQGRSIGAVQWTPDHTAFTFYRREKKVHQIWKCRLKTGACALFLDSEKVPVLGAPRREKRFRLDNYRWSPDGRHILFPTKEDLYLYDLKTKEVRRLTEDPAEERDPTFAPDGRRLAYLKHHNLYVLDLATGKEQPLTTEGSDDILIGRFDWVYEEEFGIRTGFFWSPDGRYIAYYRLDVRHIPKFPIVDFIPVHNTVEMLRYAKAGDPNAVVQIGVVPVEPWAGPHATIWMDVGPETDQYIPRIKWLPDGKRLAILRMNRDQNVLELLVGAVTDGRTRVVLREEETTGWIEIHDHWKFLKKRDAFLWTSERDGFRHIYLYDWQGNLIRQVTRGSWEVTDVAGVDERRKVVYFVATEKDPRERHLYRIGLDGKGMRRLTHTPGTHSIRMSPDAAYYLDNFSNRSTPTRTVLYRRDGRRIAVIEPNEIPALQKYRFTTPQFLTVKLPNGISLYAILHKPADFDPNRRYPVLIYTYGGPGSQIVRDTWGGARYYWHQMLVNHGYLVFSVDNRGTGGRGKAWKHLVYRRLGTYESDDQIAAARYLQTLPYVDPNRIGIWGWSYGGYNTLMSLLKGGDVFRAGVAVAPVTDWKNYDTIYTERYMDTPQDNPEGYQRGSALERAKDLKSRLLILHGSSDDNVHLANTLQMAYALENARVPFQLMIYPRKMHGIGGRDTRVHLFRMITRFLYDNL